MIGHADNKYENNHVEVATGQLDNSILQVDGFLCQAQVFPGSDRIIINH